MNKTAEPILNAYIYFMYTAKGVFRYSNKLWQDNNNLNVAKFIILKSIKMNGGKITHSKVADLSVTKKSNITALIRGMKKEKLIEIEADSIDRRVKYIKLSPKGQRVLKEALKTESQIGDGVMKGITQRQTVEMCKFFDKMLKNIDLNDEHSCFGRKN